MRWLAVIVLVGGLLRLIWLDKYPAGFNADEAAFSYNAYSILKTGQDEWGTVWWKLPIIGLKSFGDYKLPLYSFLAIPSIKIFGLNEFATRLPNAIVGTLAVLVIYFFVKQIYLKGEVVGLVAAFLLAISPWHISLSRGAFEANLGTFFLPLGLLLFLRQKYFFAAVILAFNMYSYHSARLLTPLILVVFILFFRPRHLTKFVITFLILALPTLFSLVGVASSRIRDVSILSPTDNWQAVAARRFTARNWGLPDTLARVFSNKLVYSTSVFGKNYLSYFSPQFLFTQGAGEPNYGMIPGRGVMYYPDLLFLLGFVVLIIKRSHKSYLLLLLLLLISPLPAALAKGSGSTAYRAAVMIPFIIAASTLGALYLFELLKPNKKIIILAFAFLILNFAFFVEDYLYHAPQINGPAMNYGWKELMPRLKPFADRFPDVRFSRSLSEPQIFVAFYSQMNPDAYQKFSNSWPDFQSQGYKFLDQYDGYFLDKYRFGDIYPKDPVTHPVLYVGKDSDFPPDFPEYFHIDYPTGLPAIKVAEKLP